MDNFLFYYDHTEIFHSLPENVIFVFGSNGSGRHGKGAAKTAVRYFGAKEGVAEGIQGQAYAIPTREYLGVRNLRTRPLTKIKESVDTFIDFARANQHLKFVVTRVGTGYAGYSDPHIAEMFINAPSNCAFSEVWVQFLKEGKIPEWINPSEERYPNNETS